MSKAPPPRPDARDDALAVVRRLREAGHVAYFAGGCVRDQLMGREPKDYDVATDAPPARVRELFTKTDAVGAAFGVILVRQRRSMIEVATFRTDGSYADGRRPTEVTFSTAEEDAKRRDFTINGLFFDPVENQVIDYVGGQRDIEAKVIRAIGDPDQRFDEDHLRLLRAIRFASRFDFTIEPATERSIRQHYDHLKRISPERVAGELRLMLTPPSRVVAWKLLWRLNQEATLFRFLPFPGGAKFYFAWTLFEATAPGAPIPFGLALAAACLAIMLKAQKEDGDARPLLQRSAVSKMVGAMRQGLKISNDESDEMQGALEGMEPLLRDEYPSLATRKRFLARPTAPLSVELLAAMAAVGLHRQRIEAVRRDLAALERVDPAPAPLITGDDLTAAGLNPGPVFKRVLDAVYDAQLEGHVGTKEQALEMALQLARG